MKNKGVIITIILILVLGIGITVETRQFVKENASGSSLAMGQFPESGTAAGESLPLSAAAGFQAAAGKLNGTAMAPEEAGAVQSDGDLSAAESSVPENAAVQSEEMALPMEDRTLSSAQASSDSGEESAADGPAARMASQTVGTEGAADEAAKSEPDELSAASSVAISPLSPPVAGPDALIETLTREEYGKRLAEVDVLVQNMKETSVSTNTDSLKNIADYEYRLWDAELNHIYQAVMNGMDEEESDNLRIEEREWIRQRDSDAKKAASKYKGGTMENLEYTASLASSTRSRAYEILEKYGAHLPE